MNDTACRADLKEGVLIAPDSLALVLAVRFLIPDLSSQHLLTGLL